MNNSDVYWVSLRLGGLISALKAIYDFASLVALGVYILYQSFNAEFENCGSYIEELTTDSLFVTTIIKVLFFGVLSYYCLFKGGKVHALLMRLPSGD